MPRWVTATMLLTWGLSAGAQSSLAKIEYAISSNLHPHILGAMVSTGREPRTVLLASKSPQDINRPVDIRSATKSITALLFGTGEAYPQPTLLNTPIKNLLASWGTDRKGDTELRYSVTLRDVLTMQSGFACDDWVESSVGHEDKMYQSDNWLLFWSSLPISHVPGHHFSYCTGNVIAAGLVLSGMKQKSVPAHAQETLFEPLGIEKVKWASTPEGKTDTGGHLEIGLQDIHKLGVLVLNGGRWKNQQLISPTWIKQITAPHSRVPERKEHYGMLWWVSDVLVNGKTTRLVYAHGNGGTFIVVVPSMDVVATFTGNAYNSQEQFVPLRVLVTDVLPLVDKRK